MSLIEKIKWHLKELVKTASNEPSWYSRKSIERFILFSNAVGIYDGWVFTHWNQLTFSDLTQFFICNMGYAGFLVHSIQKEKKTITPINNESKPTDI